MVTSLVKTAQDAGAEVEESVCLYEKVPYRFRENPEMAFLESELFRYSRRQYKKKKEESETCSGAISLHETKNPGMWQNQSESWCVKKTTDIGILRL